MNTSTIEYSWNGNPVRVGGPHGYTGWLCHTYVSSPGNSMGSFGPAYDSYMARRVAGLPIPPELRFVDLLIRKQEALPKPDPEYVRTHALAFRGGTETDPEVADAMKLWILRVEQHGLHQPARAAWGRHHLKPPKPPGGMRPPITTPRGGVPSAGPAIPSVLAAERGRRLYEVQRPAKPPTPESTSPVPETRDVPGTPPAEKPAVPGMVMQLLKGGA